MLFKLSVITDEVSQDLEVAAKFAYRFNLDGIEIRSVWGKNPHKLIEDISAIKKILRKYGLKVSAIASPFFKADINNEKEYVEHINILKKCIFLAKSLDTYIIRGFTFWRRNNLYEFLDKIIEKFQKPIEIVESEGVLLGIENEPSTFIGNGKELALFLDKLKTKNVKAIWDPGNDIWDPSGEKPYPEGYNYIKKKIIHVHIKDGIRQGSEGKPECVILGEGEVDYTGQLRALKEDGYKGYLSLETHWRPKKLSKELLYKPGGENFSYLGEEASKICMQHLLNILSKIE